MIQRFTFEIASEEHRKIKAISSVQGMSMKDYILGLVRKDLQKKASNFRRDNIRGVAKRLSKKAKTSGLTTDILSDFIKQEGQNPGDFLRSC